MVNETTGAQSRKPIFRKDTAMILDTVSAEQVDSVSSITVVLTPSGVGANVWDDVDEGTIDTVMDAYADAVDDALTSAYGSVPVTVQVRHGASDNIDIRCDDIETLDAVTEDVKAWIANAFDATMDRWSRGEFGS